ncbi:MAG: PQQ-binding-like beta-propeller repeat protein [Armatimonadota bacterium]
MNRWFVVIMVVAAVCVIALSCAPKNVQAAGTDWPQFRGPNADGFSADKGINKSWKQTPPAELWRIPLTDKGYAGPSVADGKVFIIDHQGSQDIIRALNLTDGQEVWRFLYDDSASANYGFARSTPVFDNGKLYTMSRLGLLHCLEAKSGKKIWAKNILTEFGGKSPTWQLAFSPLIDGKKLIVCPGGSNANVVALDKETGNVFWKGGGSDAPGYATPVIATIEGKKQYVVSTATTITGVDANSGALLWSYPWKNACNVNAAAPIVIGDNVFITSGYGRGCALFKITGGAANQVWENKEMQAHFSSPIYFNGYIFGTGDPGIMMCLDPKTGKTLWKQAGFEKGGIVAVDGTIIALAGNTGDLVMMNLTTEGYQELGRIKPLGGQSWTAPIAANGTLLVRNQNALLCLKLK